MGQIGFAVDRQEGEQLPLRGELAGKLLGGNLESLRDLRRMAKIGVFHLAVLIKND